jgi:hypothetical protein
MDTGPAAAAVSSAAPRLEKVGELASTSKMLQSGHMAETMSRSTEISSDQPTVGCPMRVGFSARRDG